MDFQIIKGSPTDDEVAALTVALAKIEEKKLMGSTPKSAISRWGKPKLRQQLRTGANGWRKS